MIADLLRAGAAVALLMAAVGLVCSDWLSAIQMAGYGIVLMGCAIWPDGAA